MRNHKFCRRVTVKFFLVILAPIAFMTASCGSSDDPANEGGPPTSGSTSTSGSPGTTGSSSTPETDSTPNTGPDEDETIVAYEVKKESSADPHSINVTFTNTDGDSETEMTVSLPWQAGGFVTVGTDVTLKAETRVVEVAPFSCTLRVNGRSFTEQSQAVTEGNDIVGAKCEVGPITAEAVVS